MKKIVFFGLALTILSLAVLPLSAQRGGNQRIDNGNCGYMDNHFMHFNMMQDKCGLTDAQVDKMYNIHKDYMEKFHQNRNNPDKMKELKDKCREEMENVLTPEQKAKRDSFAKNKMKDKRHDKKHDKAARKGGHNGHGMMHNSLGLTDEQHDKIFKINKDYMDKCYQNRKDEKKIKELRDKHHSEIQSVLTPEQRAKLEGLNKAPQKGDKRMDDKNPGGKKIDDKNMIDKSSKKK